MGRRFDGGGGKREPLFRDSGGVQDAHQHGHAQHEAQFRFLLFLFKPSVFITTMTLTFDLDFQKSRSCSLLKRLVTCLSMIPSGIPILLVPRRQGHGRHGMVTVGTVIKASGHAHTQCSLHIESVLSISNVFCLYRMCFSFVILFAVYMCALALQTYRCDCMCVCVYVCVCACMCVWMIHTKQTRGPTPVNG